MCIILMLSDGAIGCRRDRREKALYPYGVARTGVGRKVLAIW